MNDNRNENNQNAHFFRINSQLSNHLSADDETMAIINRTETSPETTELVGKRIDLARPGAMRPQWNRNLGRDIYYLRRPEEDERREIKKIDLQLKRKEMEEHIGGGYFRTIVDEIPPRP